MLINRPRWGLPRAAALTLVALTCGACSGEGAATGERWPGAPVVVISIDTLRSDRLPVYGYQAGSTPAIDRLREDSILFERAYSHAPLTLPSHASVFTGLLPDRHGVRDNLGYSLRPSETPSLQQALESAGFATGAAVSAFVLRGEAGLADGFDFYEDSISTREGLAQGVASRRGDETLAAARGWLRSVAEKSFFFFFHIYEPHTPYEAPERHSSRFESGYDAEIAAADEVVGSLIAELEEAGVYDRAIVVLLSDHGEGLGDHGEPEHGILLHREILQVPLLLKLPGGARAGETFDAPVQLVDLYPTLMEALDLPLPASLQGRALLDESVDRSALEIYAESFYPRLHFGWSDLASLIRGRYHFIDGPKPELYDLIADPAEKNNLVLENRREAGEMRRALDRYDRELEPPEDVDAETRQKLAALGYLGSTTRLEDGPLPNPLDRLPTLEDLWAAQQHQLAREYELAIGSSRKALAANPNMIDAWEILANGLENTGRYSEALDAYQEAITVAGPKGDLVLAAARMHLELGRIDEGVDGIRSAERLGVLNLDELSRAGLHLSEVGRLDEALGLLSRTASDDRPGSIVALARALSEAGRQEEALERAEYALTLDPGDARGLETAGLICLRRSDWPRALDYSRQAVEADPDRADAWNNLGAAHYFTNQPVQAIEAWREAVDRDPTQYEALFNIGLKAPELGRIDLARWALQSFVETAAGKTDAESIGAARAMLRELGG